MYTNLSLSAYPMGRSYEVPSLENSSFDTNPQASSNSILKGSCRFPVSLSVSLLLFSHLPIYMAIFPMRLLFILKFVHFVLFCFSFLQVFVKFLFYVVETSANHVNMATRNSLVNLRSPSEEAFLLKLFGSLLSCVTHLLKSGL